MARIILPNHPTPDMQLAAARALLTRRFNHPHIDEVIREVQTLQGMEHGRILMVTGPTGVGKTTLARTLLARILQQHAQAMASDPGLLPALITEVRATSEAEFNWKLFYADILEQIEGSTATPAGVDYGIDPATNRLYRPLGRSKNTVAGLRKKVEQALGARGTIALLVDEGGHLANVSDTRMKRHTDALKSLSNCTGCDIIMLGSYDILAMSRLSAQLARRTSEIHFSRYRIEDADDRIIFELFVRNLEEQAQGFFGELLAKNVELLHKNTLGCVGTLMTLVHNLITRSEQAGHISQNLLEKCLLTPGQHASILNEIRQGEERFAGPDFASRERKAA